MSAALESVVGGRQRLSSAVHTFPMRINKWPIFAGVFETWGNGIAVVEKRATSQRVRVALFIRPRPLECRSRYFARLPFGTPQRRFKHLSDVRNAP
jgi:hypothetical protein